MRESVFEDAELILSVEGKAHVQGAEVAAHHEAEVAVEEGGDFGVAVVNW
jgi:hypothetical protein